MHTTSTHSQREYCAFFQHCRSTERNCLTKAFLTTMISDSSFLKLQCISLISSVRVFIMSLSLQEKFNELCLLQGLRCFLSINSSHTVNENVTGLKEYQIRIYLFTSIQPTKMRQYSIDAYEKFQ